MDLGPYVDSVRRELMVAAEAGGEGARALAERLVAPLDSAIRLTLLNALSNAADEITRELAPGSVDVRLRGLEPTFVVTAVQADAWEPQLAQPMAPMAPSIEEEGATARINFRPPDQLKARIDAAASREGLSVNAWLVRAVTGVLNAGRNVSDRRSSDAGQSFIGWVR
jgi:hypothetical protein